MYTCPARREPRPCGAWSGPRWEGEPPGEPHGRGECTRVRFGGNLALTLRHAWHELVPKSPLMLFSVGNRHAKSQTRRVLGIPSPDRINRIFRISCWRHPLAIRLAYSTTTILHNPVNPVKNDRWFAAGRISVALCCACLGRVGRGRQRPYVPMLVASGGAVTSGQYNRNAAFAAMRHQKVSHMSKALVHRSRRRSRRPEGGWIRCGNREWLLKMAEGEGFEPPVPLRVRMISSHVHSTGLCHPSGWERSKRYGNGCGKSTGHLASGASGAHLHAGGTETRRR
jgi:hypothetical protein